MPHRSAKKTGSDHTEVCRFLARSAFEGSHTRQYLAFHPLQEGAASGGHVGHFLDHAGAAERGYGVAAAANASQTGILRSLGHGMSQRRGGGIERRRFEGTERTIPNKRLHRRQKLN